MAKKTVAAKKRNVKVDANGQLHVHSSFNNMSMRSSLADAICGLSECDEEFKTKFKQLLNETKKSFMKEIDEI